MSMDKSLRVRSGMTRLRSVLTRGERIQKLKDAERWKEGDSPFGLAKVRVYKLAMKKKKKKAKEDEEGAEALPPLRPRTPRALPKRQPPKHLPAKHPLPRARSRVSGGTFLSLRRACRA